jgi:hypothetical protein
MMRQPLRTLVAALASIAALSIAATDTSSAAAPAAPQEAPQTPGLGGTCVIQHPNCDDRSFGFGGSDAGGVVSGALPVAGTPGKKCGAVAPGQGPDATVSYEPCQPPSTEPLRPTAQTVVPRSGMTGVRPIGFDSATVGPDDRTVAIGFWSGIEPCAVLDHVALAYGSDSVTVTLFEGSDPSAGMVACPDIAMLKQVTVSLDQDLAGRAIVDGAK